MNEKLAKMKALSLVYANMEMCNDLFRQYECADKEMAPTLESLWMAQEDIIKGMRKLYKEIFGERIPYTRNEIRDMIESL